MARSWIFFLNDDSQMEWEDAQFMAQRHIERQREKSKISDEMSCEDLSEGEKEKLDNTPDLTTIKELPEIPQSPSANAPPGKGKRLYMVLIRWGKLLVFFLLYPAVTAMTSVWSSSGEIGNMDATYLRICELILLYVDLPF
jgi:hypothetical protein